MIFFLFAPLKCNILGASTDPSRYSSSGAKRRRLPPSMEEISLCGQPTALTWNVCLWLLADSLPHPKSCLLYPRKRTFREWQYIQSKTTNDAKFVAKPVLYFSRNTLGWRKWFYDNPKTAWRTLQFCYLKMLAKLGQPPRGRPLDQMSISTVR